MDDIAFLDSVIENLSHVIAEDTERLKKLCSLRDLAMNDKERYSQFRSLVCEIIDKPVGLQIKTGKDASSMIQCTKCEQLKPTSEFYKHKDAKDGYYHCCKPCKMELQREYRRKRKQIDKGKLLVYIHNHPIHKNVWNFFKEFIDGNWHHNDKIKKRMMKFYPTYSRKAIDSTFSLYLRYIKEKKHCSVELRRIDRSMKYEVKIVPNKVEEQQKERNGNMVSDGRFPVTPQANKDRKGLS